MPTNLVRRSTRHESVSRGRTSRSGGPRAYIALHGNRGQRRELLPRTTPEVPREGPPEPRRVRTDAPTRQVRRRPRDDRDGDRAQPRRQGLRAQARQRDGPRGDRERRLPDRARALQHRVQRGPDDVGGHDRPVARGRPARLAERGGAQGQRGRRAHPHDRDPPDRHAGALRGRLDERQHALPGPQRRRARCPRRGHLPRHRGLVGREARPVCGLARPRVRLHLDAAAPPGRPVQLRELLERGAGARRAAAGGRGEQPVLLRPAAVARDPDRAVQPGRRHPGGRAEEPGRPPARLLRRALGDLDLRPVRGERPLLPGAAAGAVRRGSRRRSSRPGECRRWPS